MQYQDGERVALWVNKVGPYNNPQETYNYYHLPFCRINPKAAAVSKWAGLGEALEGNQLIDSQYSIKFKGARSPRTGRQVHPCCDVCC